MTTTAKFSYADAIKTAGPSSAGVKPRFQQPEAPVTKHTVSYGLQGPKKGGRPNANAKPRPNSPNQKNGSHSGPKPWKGRDQWLMMENDDIMLLIFGKLCHRSRMALASSSKTLAVKVRLSKIWQNEIVEVHQAFTPKRLQDVLRATHASHLLWDTLKRGPYSNSERADKNASLTGTIVGPLVQLQSLEIPHTVPSIQTLKSLLPQLAGLTSLQLPGQFSSEVTAEDLKDFIPLIKSLPNLKKLVLPLVGEFHCYALGKWVDNPVHEPSGLDLVLRDFTNLESLGLYIGQQTTLTSVLWPLASKNLKTLKEISITIKGDGPVAAGLEGIAHFPNLKSISFGFEEDYELHYDPDLDQLKKHPHSIFKCVDLEHLALPERYGSRLSTAVFAEIFANCSKINSLSIPFRGDLLPFIRNLPLWNLELHIHTDMTKEELLALFQAFERSRLTNLTVHFDANHQFTQHCAKAISKISSLRYLKLTSGWGSVTSPQDLILNLTHDKVTEVDLSELHVFGVITNFPRCDRLRVPLPSCIQDFHNLAAHHFPWIKFGLLLQGGEADFGTVVVNMSDCHTVRHLYNKLLRMAAQKRVPHDKYSWNTPQGKIQDFNFNHTLQEAGIKHGFRVSFNNPNERGC